MFLFPERWVGRVTVRIDSRTDEAVFVKYEGDNIYVMKELMRIKSMPKGIELPKEFENYQDCGELGAIYLLDEVKGKGYGRILFQKAVEELKKQGYLK